jgi:hypothetical protein
VSLEAKRTMVPSTVSSLGDEAVVGGFDGVGVGGAAVDGVVVDVAGFAVEVSSDELHAAPNAQSISVPAARSLGCMMGPLRVRMVGR